MANPTTNFGWVMPTSTSLVTNLPADFNTFGQAVDTSMSELLGGTTGQVLSKTSNTNMDFTWVTPTDQTPLTTKGDLFAFSTVDARLAVGANETRLVADSTQTVGLKYVADTTNYAINAKGDLLAGTAADTLQALSVGTNGQTLVADSSTSTGLKWATASTSLTSQSANLAADVTMTSANTYYDGATISLAAGTWLIVANIFLHDAASTLPGAMGAKLWDGTTVSSSLEFRGGAALGVTGTLSAIVSPASTTTYKISGVSSGANAVIKAAQISNGSGNNAGHISAVKIA